MTKRKDEKHPVVLPKASVAWAIKHLRRFGDTDILPVPEEYDALFFDLESASEALSGQCIREHEFKVPRRLSVPKAAGGFRIASQLNPVDAVLYTAFAGEIATVVEAARLPRQAMKSCSFRVDLSDNGQFFRPGFGFDDFNRATARFIAEGEIRTVLSVDLADFYNQISHHRISNNLEAAGVNGETCGIAESILNSFASNHHSRGLPIGPAASIIFAEAAALDIDGFLEGKGVRWCRYVDDFRFFFGNEESAYAFLSEFSEVLFSNHRLATNTEKTMLWSKDDFGDHVYDGEELEEEYREIKLMSIVRSRSSSEEPDNPGSASGADRNQATRQAIDELFSRVDASEPIQVGLAKFVLRRAALLRTTKFAKRLLDNLDHFVPVVGDVVEFARAVDPTCQKGVLSAVYQWLTCESKMVKVPFLQEWAGYLLSRHPVHIMKGWSDVEAAFRKMPQDVSNRYEALAAARSGNWGRIRSLKDKVDAFDGASKRAVIIGASILPSDEKRHWLSQFESSNDVVIRACARYARAKSSI